MTAPDTPALDFKSATLYALRIVLHQHDTSALLAELEHRLEEADGFFEEEPVILDASGLSAPVDWAVLTQALRQHQLHPVGVMARGMNLSNALAHGLTQVDVSSLPRKAAELADSPATAAPPPSQTKSADSHTAEPPATAMVVNRPLRSGQRVYARGTDLVVIGMVSQGAEVIADGNIHVYGPLRGKAMAGAQGNEDARIFTTELDPELLAIAGIYRVIETALDPALRYRPALVERKADALEIQALGASAT
ncbi:MAG TPA: septum site-determining protein MinC [Burkholderiaceae bacterium]|nr:septum site-determining protein MinC [Burkholderiaceae bacterium]